MKKRLKTSEYLRLKAARAALNRENSLERSKLRREIYQLRLACQPLARATVEAFLKIVAVWTFLTVTAMGASTYYIDWTGGNDAANGLSKPTAWKTHPYMLQNAHPGYAHVAGDTFIFKGGVTWPNACFTWHIMDGGTPGSSDNYTTDPTWFLGGSFTRPVFDAEGIELSGGFDVMVLLDLAAAPHDILFSGLEFKRLYWTGPKAYGWTAFFNLQTSARININDCYLHDWTHGTFAGGTLDTLKVFIGANSAPFNVDCLISSCVVDGENAANATQGTSSGECTYAYSGNITDCTIRNMASGFIVTGDPAAVSPQVITGCEIGPLCVSFDPGAHPDGILMNGGNLFWWHDNFIHDCHTLSIYAGAGTGNEDTFIFNNVVYNCTVPPVTVDNHYSGARVYVWNNTLVGGSNFGVRVVDRGNGPLGVLDLRNNLFITDAGELTLDPGATVTSFTNQNNIQLSVGQAFVLGYTLDNLYQPTSVNAPTVGAGQDMSSVVSGSLTFDINGIARPQSLGWDAGAYQYPVGASGPGNILLSTASTLVGQNSGFVGISVLRTGGTAGAVSVVVDETDGSAVNGHDYTAVTYTGQWIDGDTGARSFTIPILASGDTATTNREFTVYLHDVSGGAALINPTNEIVTIVMNPPPPPPPSTNGGVLSFSAPSYSTTETNGSVTITVTRTGGTNAPVGVTYGTADATATAGVDYTTTTGTLAWTDNDNTAKTFSIPILNSGATGPNRFFFTSLTAPTGGALLGLSQALVSIALTNTFSPSTAGLGLQFIGKLSIVGNLQAIGGLGTNVAPIMASRRITAEGDLRKTAEGDQRIVQ